MDPSYLCSDNGGRRTSCFQACTDVWTFSRFGLNHMMSAAESVHHMLHPACSTEAPPLAWLFQTFSCCCEGTDTISCCVLHMWKLTSGDDPRDTETVCYRPNRPPHISSQQRRWITVGVLRADILTQRTRSWWKRERGMKGNSSTVEMNLLGVGVFVSPAQRGGGGGGHWRLTKRANWLAPSPPQGKPVEVNVASKDEVFGMRRVWAAV